MRSASRETTTKGTNGAMTNEQGPPTTSEKPKLFPLFYKPTPKVTSDATTSGGPVKTRRKRVAPEPDELEDVASPPADNEVLPVIVQPPSVQIADESGLTSIFSLPVPVPATRSKRTASSNKSSKSTSEKKGSAKNAEAAGASTKGAPAKPRRKSPKQKLKAPSPIVAEVIDLADDHGDIPMAGPSSSARPSPVPPTKPPKPVHPFFVERKAKRPPSPELIIVDEEVQLGGSQHDPIRISIAPDSPVAQVPFLSTKKFKPAKPSAPWPSSLTQHTRGPQTTFEDASMGSFASGRSRIPLGMPTLDQLSNTFAFGLPSSHSPSPTPSPSTTSRTPIEIGIAEQILLTMPRAHLEMPAFAPLLDRIELGPTEDEKNHEAWIDRWRPLRARDVLGNEAQAKYLKAWLRTLELGVETVITRVSPPPDVLGPTPPGRKAKGKGKDRAANNVQKRPKVIRAVEKAPPKKRRKLDDGYGPDDWIVDDEESMPEDDFDEDFDQPFNQPLNFRPSASPCKGRAPGTIPHSRRFMDDEDAEEDETQALSQQISQRLTNTILLKGPSGSGKTAAVYACAEELGWDVYEVYPGMGKRSGTNLAAIVEGVCQNHVIGVGATSGPAKSTGKSEGTRGSEHVKSKKQGLQQFFKPQAKEPTPSFGSQEEPIVLDTRTSPDEGDPFNGAIGDPPVAKGGVKVKQSLILLEEVDILFAEDKGFWTAMVDLIAASRRPVVMTCNDEAVVPLQDLPLQTILYFDPPAKPVMTSYIRCLGLANGRLVSETVASELVDASSYQPLSADLPDCPVHPLPYQEQPTIDLRQAIQQLQLLSTVNADSVAPCRQNAQAVRVMDPDKLTDVQEMLCDWRKEEPESQASSSRPDIEDDNLKAMWKFLDLVSSTDAHVDRRPERTLEAHAIDRYEDCGDDEIGHRNLRKAMPSDDGSRGLAFYSRDEEIALESFGLARGYLEAQGHGAFYRRGTCQDLSNEGVLSDILDPTRVVTPTQYFDMSRLRSARADHQRQLVDFVDAVVPGPEVPLLPRAGMILDYVPYIQLMVHVDDEQEALHAKALRNDELQPMGDVGAFSRRPSVRRQSSRLGTRVVSTHTRYMILNSGQAHAARESRLVV